MKMTLEDLIRIGDDIVDSISKSRLSNDQVLKGKVDAYREIKRTLNESSGPRIDMMKEVAGSIRDIEKQLQIVSPD